METLKVPFDIDAPVNELDQTLRGRLAGAGAATPNHDPITLLDLVDRAVERRRPFNSAGHGFRDAILWAYVTEEASRGNHVVSLANDGDFLDGKGENRVLHPTLRDAITTGVVEWFPDIGTWLTKSGRSESPAHVLADVMNLVENDREQFDANMLMAAKHATATVRDDQEIDVTITSADGPVVWTHTWVTPIPEQDGLHFARFEARLRVTSTVRIGGGLGSTIESATYTKRVTLAAEAIFDADRGELGDMTVETVEFDADMLRHNAQRRINPNVTDTVGIADTLKLTFSEQPNPLQGILRNSGEAILNLGAAGQPFRDFQEDFARQFLEATNPFKALSEQQRAKLSHLSEADDTLKPILDEHLAGMQRALRPHLDNMQEALLAFAEKQRSSQGDSGVDEGGDSDEPNIEDTNPDADD